ncbi:hypothetical protein TcG_13317 [Trypanosoma cruzi]|nr:hypothetical protein TcG_13317 [Trypanosoma cruzi]
MPGTWNSSPQSGGRTERNSRRKRKARTPRDRRFSVWRNSVPGVDPDIVPEWRYRAKARCNSCPLFDRPARALRITSNSLCRWCRPSLTAVTGPPLPPPEPPPDVSAATPCRPASGGSTFSCTKCGRVRPFVHNMTAHAGRAQPGVILVWQASHADATMAPPSS